MDHLHELEQAAYDLLAKIWDRLVEKYDGEAQVPAADKNAVTTAYKELQKASAAGPDQLQIFIDGLNKRFRDDEPGAPRLSSKEKKLRTLARIKDQLNNIIKPKEDE
ncbi:hypothetical protein MKQ68_24930 [Chitinophaga horti]|uniref:Uncharacterized protein n=1 Tax=Chitinophaga horti TaxID=2920382 RepID=A0ABY6J1Q6_9BACT|nr:hypothetical protein [Chitinophaga horti]UYQ93331.1 hypothetical protein MKQ68_24930 [Chitinophaga horti]